jgi:hypothetical protein
MQAGGVHVDKKTHAALAIPEHGLKPRRAAALKQMMGAGAEGKAAAFRMYDDRVSLLYIGFCCLRLPA